MPLYAPIGRLIDVLDEPTALKLVALLGGRRVFIPYPERLKPEGKLVAAVGYEAALKLAREWSGIEIMLPTCRHLLARERWRAIRAEPKTMPAKAVARKYNLTERSVFRIRSSRPAGPRRPAAARRTQMSSAARSRQP